MTGNNFLKNNTSRIAKRSRNMNAILLVLVLLLMTATAGVIINGINNDAARDLVRGFSIEVADKFYAFISRDLTLVQKASRSKAIINWFADEEDEEKKAAAFDEMMDYVGIQPNAHIYLGINSSLNEYIIESGTELRDFISYDRLDPASSNDYWYFRCIGSENDYRLDIDNIKRTGIWRLWIDHSVRSGQDIIGAFCSGLRVPDIFHELFTDFEDEKIRGYIIDSHGVIQSASTAVGIYSEHGENHIREESTDPAFAAALAAYEKQIVGFFDIDSEPQIIKLSKGPYGYASIKPIRSTNWSVVIFFNNYSLSGVMNLLPLLAAILLALIIYVLGRSALMNFIIFTPLGNLTQSVSKGETDFYGSERDDEIGDLARTIRDATQGRQHQEQLLYAVNSTASALLAPADEEAFEASLLEGLEFIGLCVDVDRVQIWQNEMLDEELYFVLKHQWLSENGKQAAPTPYNLKFPYSARPEWKDKFLKGEYINGPLSGQSPDDQAFLNSYDIKSIVIIPLVLENKFWGFFSIDDCHKERTFTDDEMNILHSAGLMIVSALNRNAQAALFHDENERIKLLMNATPHACRLWNRNYEIFECNDESLRLFKMRDKQEYFDRHFDLSPEYQADGQKSREKTLKILEKAFAEGRCVFEWMHQTLDGTPIPVEITLVRVKYGDDYVLAGYTRDLREQKRMTQEIERRDSLLHIINRIAAALLSPTDEKPFEKSFEEGMEMMGKYLDADCVQIWPNEIINGTLHFVLRHKWLSDIGQKAEPIAIGTAEPYNERWKELFQRGECISGPISQLPDEDREIYSSYGFLSTATIPLFYQEKFWGLFCLDDYHKERSFTEDEIDILRSAGLILVSALNRNAQAIQLREAHIHNDLMLNATPLASVLWNKNFKIFDCNDAAIKLFDLGSKQEFIDSFFDLSPKYQNDGILSYDAAISHINMAFEKGNEVFSWMHQKLDGTLIPVDVTLVRVPYGDDYVAAGYIRDLREHKKMMNEIEQRGNLLNTVNNTATVLLTAVDGKDFDASLVKGMELLGRCLGVDRIQIWQNETMNGELYFAHKYQWLTETGRQLASFPVGSKFRYDAIQGWERKLSHGECINGPVSNLPFNTQAFINPEKTKSIALIPLFVQDQFWGFFSIDDCNNERTLAEDEINILRSAGLILVSALNRNVQAMQLHEAHEHNNLMLNANPLACSLWYKDCTTFDCNDATIKLFGLKEKQEYIDRFLDISPKYQPDGSLSSEAAVAHVSMAFKEGICVRNWMHQKVDGTPIPSEVTLVRVPYGDDYVVAGYVRDLREQEKMMGEIRQRDNMLNTMNQVAAILLLPDIGTFEDKLQQCMKMIGGTVNADRVCIWKNSVKDGKLFCAQMNEWVSEERLQTPAEMANGVPYENNIPTWEKLLPQGICINTLTRDLSQEEQKPMAALGILSVFAAPVFVNDEFWGFVGCDNCKSETVFTDDEVSILRSGSLLIANALLRNVQAEQLQDAHEHTQLLLDAMPFACNLWDKNYNIFGCNEEHIRLFGLKDKQDILEHFTDLSPEFQPNGRPSSEKTIFLKRAFEEGRCVFEWMHQKPDGTPIPTEVTLVRVMYDDDYAVAGYVRDLREHKIMMEEIERTTNLLNIVNNVATIMLQSDIIEFDSNLLRCMGMVGDAVGADRITVWKNYTKNNSLYCTQISEWLCSTWAQTEEGKTTDVSYDTNIPGWQEILSQDKCISRIVSTLSPEEQEQLAPWGITYLFVAPIFMSNEFWGYVGFDICKDERTFSESEQYILRSGSMLIATALLRNEMTLNIHDTANKLEAVVVNYAGVIWSVDQNHVITLFNGRYLNELGKKAEYFEGRKIDDALLGSRFIDIHEGVIKTFIEGPQDINSEIDGKIYRTRTTPIHDNQGKVTNIVGTFDDVTERSRLQSQLKTALYEAQKANEAKSSFLANMSHEMRTPLNAVIGLSELTLGEAKLHKEANSNLEKIYNAGMTLLSTVNDILDISKIEAGKFELMPVEYDIPSMLNDAITQSVMRIGEKPIHFMLEIDENLPTRLYGDDLRIKQILNNLLSNAFKYTREGTVKLDIGCKQEGDAVWIIAKVTDTGIGIRKEDIESLFADYSQVDTKSHRKIEGTGLGLSITRRLAELMDGSVSVKSEYGRGSTFTVTIRQKFITGDKIGADVVKNLKHFQYSTNKRNINSRLSRIKLPYAKVLLVDDVVTNLDVAKGMMKPYGMHIDCVTSGQEAIDAIRSGNIKYNAIFMDHMMPEMDGIEATRIIREEIKTEYAKKIPIIALTANAIVGNEKMFLSKGFQAFISKPIEMDRLDYVIRQWVRDKKLETENSKNEKKEQKEKTQTQNIPFQIKGINLNKGLERFGNDVESYLQILQSYADNTLPLLETAQRITKNKLSDYAITVHGLKSSSMGICADSVGSQAEALEKAAVEGNYDFIKANNAKFIKAAQKLVADLTDMLKKISVQNPKPGKKEPDKSILQMLVTACKNYDMDGVDRAMAELEQFEYKSGSKLVLWLRKNVDQMNFLQITEKLSDITG